MLSSCVLAIMALSLGTAHARTLGRCVQGQNCHLPDCFCPTFHHPDFSDVKDIPQMVYFGFDDALNVQVEQFYRQLFTSSHRNPNGCPITMSLYVQHAWTSYSLVESEYGHGNEIGSHSVTHTNIDNRTKLDAEAREQKDNLVNKGKVDRSQVVGWRSPNLKTAGDDQPDVLKSLGYTYDISLTYTRMRASDPVPWPFTLDYGYPYRCSIRPCPGASTSHPGFWEIPANSLYDPVDGFPRPYVDSGRPADEAAALHYLWSNFQQVYQGNRAPFGLNMHAAWFFTKEYLNATLAFLSRLQQLPDVYVISAKQVLDWMRDPVKVSDVHKLAGWRCNHPSPTTTSTTTTTPKPTTTTTTTTTTTPKPTTTTTTTQKPTTTTTTQKPTTTTTTTQKPTTTTISTAPTTTTPTPTTTSTPTPTTITSKSTTAFRQPHDLRILISNSTSTTTTITTPSTTTTTTTTTIVPSTSSSTTTVSGAVSCVQDVNCYLPSCQCQTFLPPGGLSLRATPQIVYITITGNINGLNYARILDLLSERTPNPNGCPIRATLFVPSTGNYLPYIQGLRSRGHEIAMSGSDDITGADENMIKEQLQAELREFEGLNNTAGLVAGAGGINRGYRSRASHSITKALLETLTSSDVTYDASVMTSRPASLDDVLSWPYTLDYGWHDTCAGAQCPSQRYPGLWEVPVVPLVDFKKQFTCTYADACFNRPTTAQDTFQFLAQNLQHALDTTRAPLGIHLRKEWFSHPVYTPNLQGLAQFLDDVRSRGDVYVTSVEKMLDWMKSPTKLENIASLSASDC